MTTLAAPFALLPPPAATLAGYAVRAHDGLWQLDLFVDGLHCGGCVRRVEGALLADSRIASARLNLSTRRLLVRWPDGRGFADSIIDLLNRLGYTAVPYSADDVATADAAQARALQLAFGVAFFGLSNVMMLSWALWSGSNGDAMGPGTRGLFQWLSALIALPCIAYAGRTFFRSAWAVLRRGQTNMDVPIAAGVLLTTAMSLSETIRNGPHVYFDGALSLLTVLLLGRWLDHRARCEARSGVTRLAELAARPVTLLHADAGAEAIPAARVLPGQRILVSMGERIGVDGVIDTGQSSIDASLITGEALPQQLGPGDPVLAGMTNLGQPLTIIANRPGSATAIAEMVQLLEAAEQKRGRHVGFADRAVRLYTPVVHLAALGTFLGWWLLAGQAWQAALVTAVCVLIIACPCALGLAVPVTQVVAAGRLMRRGILLKSDSALERMAMVDTVVFDKTGTLTRPGHRVAVSPDDPASRRLAAGMAATSRHPLAASIRGLHPDVPALAGVTEAEGEGLSWQGPDGEVRLGSAKWCGVDDGGAEASMVWLTGPGLAPTGFSIGQTLRADAAATCARLLQRGLGLAMLSGDHASAAGAIAAALGIADWQARLLPAEKVAAIADRQAAGRHVLMVGDGINDAAAMASATASMAPACAADISRTTADVIWLGDSLSAVAECLHVACRAQAIVRQNIGFSFLYNGIWVPVAMAGLVTPWVAALAMAASSLAVTLNALRLRGRRAA